MSMSTIIHIIRTTGTDLSHKQKQILINKRNLSLFNKIFSLFNKIRVVSSSINDWSSQTQETAGAVIEFYLVDRICDRIRDIKSFSRKCRIRMKSQ